MSHQVVAGSDLAGRRAARQAYERPWVKSQTPSSSCIRNRPALHTTTTLHSVAVQGVQARAPPAKQAPVSKPVVATTAKVGPRGPQSSRVPLAAARKSHVQVRSGRTPTVGAVASNPGASAPTTALAGGSQLKSALRKAGTTPKRVTWGGNNEVAIYTKGMKTKFFNRGFVAVPEEAN